MVTNFLQVELHPQVGLLLFLVVIFSLSIGAHNEGHICLYDGLEKELGG